MGQPLVTTFQFNVKIQQIVLVDILTIMGSEMIVVDLGLNNIVVCVSLFCLVFCVDCFLVCCALLFDVALYHIMEACDAAIGPGPNLSSARSNNAWQYVDDVVQRVENKSVEAAIVEMTADTMRFSASSILAEYKHLKQINNQ